MLHSLIGFLLLFQASTSQSDQPSFQRPSTFSVSVDLVKVPISVFDDVGVLKHDLKKSDFRLYEDEVLQDIRSCSIDYNPVSVVLLIDTSATVEKEFKKIKDAARYFAAALSDEDRIAVIAFSDGVDVVVDWTNDKKSVGKALKKLEPGFRTALYDAMYTAAAKQLKGVEGRKAIILLTDGLNNMSSLSFGQAAQSIVQSQASLYVVSKTAIVKKAARTQRKVIMLSDIYRRITGEDNYIDEFFAKIEDSLTDLSEKTGGRCFFPTDYDQLRGVYGRVARELKSKYYLTYISNQQKGRNTFHHISIVYYQPSSRLIYRRGYFFKPDPIPRWLK